MPATDVTFGITRHTGALIDSVETDDQVTIAELSGSDGEIARVKPHASKTTFSVKGHGTLTVVPGVGSSNITTLTTGLTVIQSVKKTDHNTNWDDWEYSGTNYPSAIAA